METMSAEDIGRRAVVVGDARLSDLALLAEIARLEKSVASFGGAMLLAAHKADAQRRGFKVN
jgi:hypothetical protein